MCEISGIAVLLIVAICTIVGAIQIIAWLARSFHATLPTLPQRTANSPSPIALCQFIDQLYRDGTLDRQQYLTLRNQIENRFANRFILPNRLGENEVNPLTGIRAPADTPSPAWTEVHPESGVMSAAASSSSDQAVPTLSTADAIELVADASIPIAEVVEKQGVAASSPLHVPAEPNRPLAIPDASSGPLREPAQPWRPDLPPEIVPRRTWQQALKGFMEERNIRWGELASGILIVGSAVGLVTSLRRELENTIPYFPALLFLLISLALYGAGAYTLRRWRLRNTSRGLLIISLLMVPLNILASALLTAGEVSRRNLSDPIVWLALTVGTIGFGWILWSAMKHILRRGFLPIFAAMVVACGTIVVANRWPAEQLPLLIRKLLAPAFGLGGLVTVWLAWQAQHRRHIKAESLFRFVFGTGLITFALIIVTLFCSLHVTTAQSIFPAISLPWGGFAAALLGAVTVVLKLSQRHALPGYRIGLTGMWGFVLTVILAIIVTTLPYPNEFRGLCLLWTTLLGVVAIVLRNDRAVSWAMGTAAIGITVHWGCVSGKLFESPPEPISNLISTFLSSGSALIWLAAGSGYALLMYLTQTFWLRNQSDQIQTRQSLNIVSMINEVSQKDEDSQKDDHWLQRQWSIASSFAVLGAAIALIAARIFFYQFEEAALGSVALAAIAAVTWLRWWPAQQQHSVNSYSLSVASLLTVLAVIEPIYFNQFAHDWLSGQQWQWQDFGLGTCVLISATHSLVACYWICRGPYHSGKVAQSAPRQYSWPGWLKTTHENNYNISRIWSADVGAAFGMVGWLFIWGSFYQENTHVQFVLVIVLLTSIALNVACDWPRLMTLARWASAFGCLWLATWPLNSKPNLFEIPEGFGHYLNLQLALAAWCFAWMIAEYWQFKNVRNVIDGRKTIGLWIASRRYTLIVLIIAASLSLLTTATGWIGPISAEILALSQGPQVNWSFTAIHAAMVAVVLCSWLSALGFAWLTRLSPEPHATPTVARNKLPASITSNNLVQNSEQISAENPDTGISSHHVSTKPQVDWQTELDNLTILPTLAAALVIALVSLLAVPWVTQIATASALRWIMAIATLFVAGIAWVYRSRPSSADESIDGAEGADRDITRSHALLTALTLCIAISLGLGFTAIGSFWLVGREMWGGPLPNSWFALLPKEITFGVPLAFILSALLSLGISERRERFANVGSYVLRFSVVFQLFLLLASPHPRLATSWFIQIVHSVSMGMTFYGLVWFWQRMRMYGTSPPEQIASKHVRDVSSGLSYHTYFNLVLTVGLAVIIHGRYFLMPHNSADWLLSVANPMGIVATILSFVLGYLTIWRRNPADWPTASIVMASCLIAIVALLVDRIRQQSGWVSYQVLIWGWIATTVIGTAIQGWTLRSTPLQLEMQTRPWLRLAGTIGVLVPASIAILFNLRGLLTLTNEFWILWTTHWIAIGCVLFTACCRRQTRYFIAALVLSIAPVWNWGILDPQQHFQGNGLRILTIQWNVWTLITLVWLVNAINYSRSLFPLPRRSLTFIDGIAIATLVWLWLYLQGLTFLDNFTAGRFRNHIHWEILTLILLASALVVISYWNLREMFRSLKRFLWGLVIASLFVQLCYLQWPQAQNQNWQLMPFTHVAWSSVLGISVLIWSFCFSLPSQQKHFADRLGIKRWVGRQRELKHWIPRLNGLVTMVILAVAFVISLTGDPRSARLASTGGLFLSGLAYVGYANVTRRNWHRHAAVFILSSTAILVMWAERTLQIENLEVLPLVLRLFIALTLVALLMRWGGRWLLGERNHWWSTLQRDGVILQSFAVVALVGLVLAEGYTVSITPDSATNTSSALAVALLAICLVASFIAIAVVARRDPFALSEFGRRVYVYLAQFTLGLALAHAIISMPWLFQFGLREYWPYIAMFIGFFGVGVLQLLERRSLQVLSVPLGQTISLLPIAVVMGAAVWPSQTDQALVTFLAGLVYAVAGVQRPSVMKNVLAFVFANCALWIYLNRQSEWSLWNHPQLWLIPPAISVLWLTRDSGDVHRLARIDAPARRSIQYVAWLIIYLSSTSEIFIQGLGDKLWPPMILIGLALVGMLAGMLFAIRQWIYLGIVFLLFAMTAMVAHAQHRLNHVWPWWAFGITVGLAILIAFGWFEQRRNLLKKRGSLENPVDDIRAD